MKKVPFAQNVNTQPQTAHKVFNNWEVVTEGWYIACPSKDLKEKPKSMDLNGQHIVVWRNANKEPRSADGFCAHMGVDLGIGSVKNGNLQCFFHHWQYNEEGNCIDIPCQKNIPEKAKLHTYATCEKYGFVWVYPKKETDVPLLEIPELEGQNIRYSHGKKYERKCHFHITMINGIDPQHLKTVHDIHMDMDLNISEQNNEVIDIELSGETPNKKFSEKIIRAVLGDKYAYSMKYANGCVAALTVMKGVKLFNRYSVIPTLNMIFAYQTNKMGKTIVQPIYIAKKRNFFIDKLLLFFTKMAFFTLQGEDGEVYENIRFKTDGLLSIDAPVAKYIKYINSLTPSVWSREKL